MTIQMFSAYSDVLNVNGIGNFPWLKDVKFPELSMEFEVFGKSFDWDEDMGQGSFDAIGRKLAITITDTPKGAKFDFDVALPTVEQNDLFEANWESKTTKLLQLPDGRQWWVVFQTRKTSLITGSGPYAEVSVKMIETDEP